MPVIEKLTKSILLTVFSRGRFGIAITVSLLLSMLATRVGEVNRPGPSGDEKARPLAVVAAGRALTLPEKGAIGARLSMMQMQFEANRGQADEAVRFISRGTGFALFLTSDSARLKLRESGGREAALNLRFEGADPEPRIESIARQPGLSHYFIGNDPAKWLTDIPNYGKVRYRGLYPGIDLVWYGNGRQLEYDFVVSPGSDPARIRMAYSGQSRLYSDQGGNLVLSLPGGEVLQHNPIIYQDVDGKRRPIRGRYLVSADNTVTFEVESYDRSRELIIDPVISFSTYIGGGLSDEGNGIAVDATGNVYLTGRTFSTDYPTTNSTALAGNLSDVFVTKIGKNAAGDPVIGFSAYIGGADDDAGKSIFVDSAGSIYLSGTTASTSFPVVKGYQKSLASGAFLQGTKKGDQWTVSSAGVSTNTILDLAVEPGNSSNIYVAAAPAGILRSADGGATWNPSNGESPGNSNVLYSKDVRRIVFSPSAGPRLYAATAAGMFRSDDRGASWSQINGTTKRLENTDVRDIAINRAETSVIYVATGGGVYKTVTGGSSWDAASNGIKDRDIRVLALAQIQNPVIYAGAANGGVFRSRDRGTSWVELNKGLADTRIRALLIDPSKSSVIYAGTRAGVFRSDDEGDNWAPISGDIGNTDIRSLAIDPADSKVLYAVTAGGVFRTDDGGKAWKLKNSGQANNDLRVILIDPSNSDKLYLGATGANDAFLVKMSPAGELVYSTYLGGGGTDNAGGLKVDGKGNAYIAGTTYSTNLPVKSALKAGLSGTSDAYAAKIDTTLEGEASLVYSTYLGGQGSDQGEDLALDSSGSVYLAGLAGSSDFPVTTGSLQTSYGNQAVLVSADSAGNWKSAGRGIAGDTVSALASGNKILIAGNPLGIFTSDDGGTTWATRRTDVEVRAIVIDPKNSDLVYAGTATGVLKSTDRGKTWSSVSSFQVRSLEIDSAGNASVVYAGTTSGGLYRSSDAGASWTPVNGPVLSDKDCTGCLPGARLDPSPGSTNVQAIAAAGAVYVSVAGRGVYQSLDQGGTWKAASQGFPGGNSAIQVSINQLAIDPSMPSTLYAGTDKGLYKSTDAAGNWTRLVAAEIDDNIRVLVIDTGSPSRLYVATSKGVFKSSDGGGTWVAGSNGLSSLNILDLAIDVTDNKKLYAASGGGVGDAFVAKLNPEGKVLLYSTMLGGGDSDSANAITLAGPDLVYVTGGTFSTNFPTTGNAYSRVNRGISDAFIACLDLSKTSAAALSFSSYLGGNGLDRGNALALGPDNRVYIAGSTSSLDFPISQGIVNNFRGGSDAFATVIRSQGSDAGKLVYSTYLGGSGNDSATGIALDRTDATGSVWITGTTSSPDMILTGKAIDRTCGSVEGCRRSTDLFLVQIGNGGGAADLVASLGHSGLFRVGQTGSITVTVTNNGPDPASAPVTVVDTLPPGLSFVSAAGGGMSCLPADNIVTCASQEPLPAGNSRQVTITVRVGASAEPAVKNSATVGSTTSDPLITGAGANSASDLITIDKTVCSFILSQSSSVFPSTGGEAVVGVTTQNACDWTAVGNDDFILILARNNSQVSFRVLENKTTQERRGSLSIAGQTYAVTQQPACGYEVSPASASIKATGDSGTINITAAGGCPWRARLNDSIGFVTLTSPASGSGNGSVTFTATPNPTSGNRTATIDILAGNSLIKSFSIDQAESGCSYSISPSSASFGGAGGDGTVRVTSGKDSCDWSVINGNPEFITIISGSRQSGNEVFVSYRVAPNPISAQRSGSISIAGIPFTVTQSGGAGTACTYNLDIDPAQQGWGPAGGSGSIAVTAPNGCGWQAAPSSGFLAINGPSSGSGSGKVNFTVAPNPGSSARSAFLTIAGLTVIFFQDAPKSAMSCQFTVREAVTTFGDRGGDSFVLVTAAMDVCQWKAASDSSFVKLRNDTGLNVPAGFNPLVQTGTAYLVFVVEPNAGSAPRTATLTIAGSTVRITQSGKPAKENQNDNVPQKPTRESAILPRRIEIRNE